jgi:uncharacterized protein
MAAFGKFVWQDLTVQNAEAIKDFYCAVVGWTATSVPMGGHDDYSIHAGGTEEAPIGGICHNKKSLAEFPAQWLLYVTVADLTACLEKCIAHGGTVVTGPLKMGNITMAIIQDPAGAYLGLTEEG